MIFAIELLYNNYLYQLRYSVRHLKQLSNWDLYLFSWVLRAIAYVNSWWKDLADHCSRLFLKVILLTQKKMIIIGNSLIFVFQRSFICLYSILYIYILKLSFCAMSTLSYSRTKAKNRWWENNIITTHNKFETDFISNLHLFKFQDTFENLLLKSLYILTSIK